MWGNLVPNRTTLRASIEARHSQPESFWNYLRWRYPLVQPDGRLNHYLRVTEAGTLTLSLISRPEAPELDLYALAREHGAVQLNVIPILEDTIRARNAILQRVIQEADYDGVYLGNAYAGKANDKAHVAELAVRLGDHYETSSRSGVIAAFNMWGEGTLPQGRLVICNGYLTPDYTLAIQAMRRGGFQNIIPVLNKPELLNPFTQDPGPEKYSLGVRQKIRHGVKTLAEADASDSRFGMRFEQIKQIAQAIQTAKNTELVLYHVHLGSQIANEEEYLAGLRVAVEGYCRLKLTVPSLKILDIGGGMPVAYSLAGPPFDLAIFWHKFLLIVKEVCAKHGVEEPNLLTEWGRHTVADYELHLMALIGLYDHTYQSASSVMSTLPDYWGIGQAFLLLPVQSFNRPWDYFQIAGATCDEDDVYFDKTFERASWWQKTLLMIERRLGLISGKNLIPLPVMHPSERQKYFIVFAVTGAYQDNIGPLQHCLQLEEAELTLTLQNNQWVYTITKPGQTPVEMLRAMEFKV